MKTEIPKAASNPGMRLLVSSGEVFETEINIGRKLCYMFGQIDLNQEADIELWENQ